MHRGLGRTIGGLLKLAFWTTPALAAVTVIAVALFHLIAIDQSESQKALMSAATQENTTA
jgi:hypothetical protein